MFSKDNRMSGAYNMLHIIHYAIAFNIPRISYGSNDMSYSFLNTKNHEMTSHDIVLVTLIRVYLTGPISCNIRVNIPG